MPATALALTLASAFLHATWNLLIARSDDPRSTTAVAVVIGWLISVPVAVALWRIEPSAWPFILASGVAETIYVIVLARAYDEAELSVVYPVARGMAPIVVLVVSASMLGAATDALQVLGIVAVGLGVVLVRGVGTPSRRGVGLGLVIAVTIATYTLIDSRGVQHASPIPYLVASMTLPALAYPLIVGRTRGRAALRAALGWPAAVAGVLTFCAYALVLGALTLAPPAPVAAVRETSVLIATAFAVWILHENVSWTRAAGALLVVIGVALVVR